MKIIFSLLLAATLVVFPPRAHAIIILPALILVPLAQLLAVVVSAFSLPAITVGVLIAKIKNNRRLAIVVPLAFLITLTAIAALILQWRNPDRPWF